MKLAILLIFTIVSLSPTLAQNLLSHTKSGRQILLGTIEEADLHKNDFSEWFNKNYSNYTISDSLLSKIESSLQEIKIEIYMGTWCPDSQREVPAFLKILHQSNFDFSKLTIVAVDYEGNDMKQSPTHEEIGKEIYRVPTFLFIKDEKELGRIVEYPSETLENDILKVMKGEYNSSYFFYHELLRQIRGHSFAEMEKMKPELLNSFRLHFEGNRKLLTLSKVLFDAQEIGLSRFIMELQLSLNPDEESSKEFYNIIITKTGID